MTSFGPGPSGSAKGCQVRGRSRGLAPPESSSASPEPLQNSPSSKSRELLVPDNAKFPGSPFQDATPTAGPPSSVSSAWCAPPPLSDLSVTVTHSLQVAFTHILSVPLALLSHGTWSFSLENPHVCNYTCILYLTV